MAVLNSVDRNFDAISRSRSETLKAIAENAEKHGYRPSTVGVDRFGFVRTRRPRWAIALGLVLAPTLVGLLFFLVRRPQMFWIGFEESYSGLGLRVQGTIEVGLLRWIESFATSGSTPKSTRAIGVDPSGDPKSGVRPSRSVVPPADALSASPLRSSGVSSPWLANSGGLGRVEPNASPVNAKPVGPTDVLNARTRVVSTRGTGDPSLTLDLSDGRRYTIDRFTLVGRDPSPAPGQQDVQLVGILDPSISKNHAAFRVDDGVWVADCRSTNGTSVIDLAGVERPVNSAEGTKLSDGDRIVFGRVIAQVRSG